MKVFRDVKKKQSKTKYFHGWSVITIPEQRVFRTRILGHTYKRLPLFIYALCLGVIFYLPFFDPVNDSKRSIFVVTSEWMSSAFVDSKLIARFLRLMFISLLSMYESCFRQLSGKRSLRRRKLKASNKRLDNSCNIDTLSSQTELWVTFWHDRT